MVYCKAVNLSYVRNNQFLADSIFVSLKPLMVLFGILFCLTEDGNPIDGSVQIKGEHLFFFSFYF